ncbi:MAG: hypothetical protein H7836_04645 [Magnetococcus sp. YQC-3]
MNKVHELISKIREITKTYNFNIFINDDYSLEIEKYMCGVCKNNSPWAGYNIDKYIPLIGEDVIINKLELFLEEQLIKEL